MTMPDFFAFHSPTRVVFGSGMSRDLGAELGEIGVMRCLLVSDRTMEGLGHVEAVTTSLNDSGVAVTASFLDVPPDSDVDTVTACAVAARESGAEGLVALGGGSVMDTAKASNIIFSLGGDLVEDYSGANTVTSPLAPLIAIPTTAGTGSEVTTAAVIYDPTSQSKLAFSDPHLLPRLAVLDPDLTLSLPPSLTASTAMDALTHAVEAYVSPEASPLSDALAAGAVRLIVTHVEQAVVDGTDRDARGALLSAASMAGIAFSHAMVGCVHGMAHAVGGLFHVPHGVANAILLPCGLEYNIDVTAAKLAGLLSVFEPSERVLIPVPDQPVAASPVSSGAPAREAAAMVITAIRDLTQRLHDLGAIPLRLREVGVPEEGLRAAAEAAVDDGTSFYNPREVVAEEILDALRRAY
jgi:alcohol dehydrogenase